MILVVVSARASGGEPELFGYQLKTVLSGSMEPGIQTGSIIVVEKTTDPEGYAEGDVITYIEEGDILVTHRITEVISSGENVMYRTKGDNNENVDTNPVLSENVVAEYTGYTIPYVGYFLDFTNTKNGAFLFIIPGILLVLYSIFTIWKAIAQIEVATKKEKPVEENIS